MKTRRLVSVEQAADLYPAFTVSALRWLIIHKKYNGFSRCVFRSGRKIVIDLDEFEEWIDSRKDYKSRKAKAESLAINRNIYEYDADEKLQIENDIAELTGRLQNNYSYY